MDEDREAADSSHVKETPSDDFHVKKLTDTHHYQEC